MIYTILGILLAVIILAPFILAVIGIGIAYFSNDE